MLRFYQDLLSSWLSSAIQLTDFLVPQVAVTRGHSAISKRYWLIVLLLYQGIAAATSVRTMTIDELVNGSELVIEGRVLNITTEKGVVSERLIRTKVTIEVMDVLKGNYDPSTITLSFLGGTFDDRRLQVDAMEYPEMDEHGIYFIESADREQVHPLLGWSQGHLLVKANLSGQLGVQSRAGAPVVIDDDTDQLMVNSIGLIAPAPQSTFTGGVIWNESISPVIPPPISVLDFKAKIKVMAK